MKRVQWPFYISKTVNVFIVPPYNLVVEYETGEKRMLDLEKYIDEDPELRILKEDTELFNAPMVSLCGYKTAWESENHYVEFHNDIVFVYGEDVQVNELETIEISVDEELLSQVKEVLKPYGLTPEDAIVMFLRYCVDPATRDHAIELILQWKHEQEAQDVQ